VNVSSLFHEKSTFKSTLEKFNRERKNPQSAVFDKIGSNGTNEKGKIVSA